MSPFHALLPLVGVLVMLSPAWADEQNACTSGAGTLLTGTVTALPRFAHGYHRRGVELSHTHVRLRDVNGKTYDIAVDNVFADGYDDARKSVPAPLSRIRPGDHLDVCGKLYTRGRRGMDWVHPNCGVDATEDHPNGWVKVIGADGQPGPNLDASEKYCRLWRRR